MEYKLEVSYNCGLETAVSYHPTFTAAYKIAQMFDGNPNVDIYITPSDGKYLYEKLVSSELFVAERDRADFDEIITCVKASKGTYPNFELHIH